MLKMQQKRFGLFALALILFSGFAQAQTLRSYVKAGDAAFESGAYEKALAYYKIASEVEPSDATYLLKAADAARFLSAHQIAESYYNQIPAEARIGDFADANYGQALSSMYLGNYDKAITLFNTYIAANGGMSEFAKTQRGHAEWAKGNAKKLVDAPPTHLEAPINSNFTDLAPVFHKGKLYVTSAWKANAGDPYRMIIYSNTEGSRDAISVEGLNASMDMANAAFSPDGKLMFCSVRDNATTKEFMLAVCEVKGDNTFGAPRMLEVGLQGTQPAVGYDSIARKTMLYFASTRVGGKGGSDIWAAELNGATLGTPMNVSAINTTLEEVTPMFYTPHQMLYFSSNGHDNLGGLDVFRSQRLGEFTKPANLNAPLNSSYDDLYYHSAFSDGRSYVSSNRPGNLCEDPKLDCQCNDIYESKYELALQINTFDKLTAAKLDSATVRMINLTTGLEEKMEFNPKSNQFYFPLKFDNDYMLVSGRGANYSVDTTRFTTRGITGSKTITQNLYMQPAGIFLDVFVFDALTKQPISASTVALDNMGDAAGADRNTNNAANDYHYDTKAGNKYRIEASKSGYSTDIIEFAIPADVKAPRRIVKNVYLARTIDLPATVYFENDYPNPRTRTTNTSIVYKDHYNFYYGLKPTYKKKGASTDELESFFEGDVRGGMERLDRVCEQLSQYLAQGYSLQVVFEGYASPRAESDYNVFLTQRRINSVLNYFNTWKGGAMSSYIAAGKLKVTQQPNGENTAPAGINDQIANPRLSWYAPAAARERRVVIVDIRRQAGTLSLEYDGKNDVR